MVSFSVAFRVSHSAPWKLREHIWAPGAVGPNIAILSVGHGLEVGMTITSGSSLADHLLLLRIHLGLVSPAGRESLGTGCRKYAFMHEI
jgi:hypothetical protein